MREPGTYGQRLGPLLLLPTAIGLVGFLKDVSEYSAFLAKVCKTFLDFCAALWVTCFGAIGLAAPDRVLADFFTLWVAASIAIWTLPSLTPETDGRVLTTVGALQRWIGWPSFVSYAVGLALILVSSAVIVAPFASRPDPETGQTLLGALAQSQALSGGDFSPWLRGDGIWFAWVLVGLAGVLLLAVYALIGPRLAAAALSPAERRDLKAVAIALWLLSAAFVTTAVTVGPIGVQLGGFAVAQPDLMVASLLTLVALVAWRSALPFVQVASLMVAILTIDAGIRFITDIWTRVGGGG